MSETTAKSACSWVSVVPVDVIKNKHKYLAKNLVLTYFIKKKLKTKFNSLCEIKIIKFI